MAKVICMDTDVQKTFFSFSKSPVPNSNEINAAYPIDYKDKIAEFKKASMVTTPPTIL